jgi:hypothetical protein
MQPQSHHYKTFFKGFCTQKVKPGILHTESETQHNHESAGSTKLQEKKKVTK